MCVRFGVEWWAEYVTVTPTPTPFPHFIAFESAR